jgi:phospholipase/carboxylesterase
MLHTEFIAATEGADKHLIIVLHGLGDSLVGYRWLPHAMQLPWLNYLLVNAPDSYYGGFSWYDIDGDSGPGIERSRRLLFELLDEQRKNGFATDKTVVFGFSQGCLLSMELGARYPHLFAGIVGISGYVHEPEKLIREFSPVARRQRFLITHGTADPLIPIAQVRLQMEQLQAAGLQIEWREFVKAHTIAGVSELTVIRDFVCAVAKP